MSRAREMRWALEAQWTKAQAIAAAEKSYEDTGKWPTRRFRVETDYCGNSRLLPLGKATSIANRVGGRVVEMIPSRTELRLMRERDDQ